MKYISALPLAAGLAAAQMQVMSVAPADAPAGAATHTVTVGGLKAAATGMVPVLGFTPESITANMGDMVVFQFMQKNHTATQSTFDQPCKKMEGGMDSGFMPNPEGKPGVTWNMTVSTTEPLWFYCKQQTGTHCGVGMVMSINAKTDNDKTMADFKNLAIKTNGTNLKQVAIQEVNAAAAAAPSTVTVQAGGAGAGAAAATGTGGTAAATVVAGQGTNQNGQTCSCQCLCGMNAFPPQAAVNNFGGFAGMIA
ncbi:hypothetical protein CC80DRAFT_288633 [Byssothecium circinans]|uniref:Cupredoxin n=1 Tax=Byssothecium circinans TaxID=147558 RepID=A0A6A5UGK5_9PLEO|nr:hypothetical protein CC80DRAFT_288633 [Byssothecium circinans]